MSIVTTVIVDPICFSLIGHNYNHVRFVRDWLHQLEPDANVVAWVSDEFSQGMESQDENLCSSLPLVYPEVYSSKREPSAKASHGPRQRMSLAWGEILNSALVSRIVMPGADYWSVVTLADTLKSLPERLRPEIIALRFLGILEFAGRASSDPASDVCVALQALSEMGMSVRIAAESPELAGLFAGLTGLNISCLPSLATVGMGTEMKDSVQPSETLKDGDGYVYLPGTGRLDKGLAISGQIIHAYRDSERGSSLRFVAHRASPTSDPITWDAERRLYGLPGVDLVDSWLPDSEMEVFLQECEMVLLPYDADTYGLRSSAILGDAIAFAKPVITFDGTGLSTLVRFYDMGLVVSNVREAVEAIALVRASRVKWQRRAQNAKCRFESDTRRAWNDWLAR